MRRLVAAGFSTGMIYKILRQWDVPDEALAALDNLDAEPHEDRSRGMAAEASAPTFESALRLSVGTCSRISSACGGNNHVCDARAVLTAKRRFQRPLALRSHRRREPVQIAALLVACSSGSELRRRPRRCLVEMAAHFRTASARNVALIGSDCRSISTVYPEELAELALIAGRDSRPVRRAACWVRCAANSPTPSTFCQIGMISSFHMGSLLRRNSSSSALTSRAAASAIKALRCADRQEHQSLSAVRRESDMGSRSVAIMIAHS